MFLVFLCVFMLLSIRVIVTAGARKQSSDVLSDKNCGKQTEKNTIIIKLFFC